MSSVAIIDYGMGNLRSVAKAVEHVFPQGEVIVTDRADVVSAAERVIFPGQGAMPDCMRELEMRGLRVAVVEAARSKPFLGICIGLQMLFERSQEGNQPGLALFAGDVVRFPDPGPFSEGPRLKVPHMGWNEVMQTRHHPLWNGIGNGARFYFVHSFYPAPVDENLVAARTTYGAPFCCAISRRNLFAVQFHPEKSQAVGLTLLRNFVGWDGNAS